MSMGRYIPPALRSKPPTDYPPTPPRSPTPNSTAQTRSNTKTPWSNGGPGPTSLAYLESLAQQTQTQPPNQSRSSSANRSSGNQNSSQARGNEIGPSAPTLHVFGDSFVGPLKLLSEECVKVTTYKGASAKGLNNPNSIKQVSTELLPAVNRLLAPPSYAYIPSWGRWVLLIFGNVDLQINYLWQLQTKQISHLSFPAESPIQPTSELPASSSSSSHSDSNSDESDDNSLNEIAGSKVLASATETSTQGPALGPELFVKAILQNYTTWLEREIINGPIGERLLSAASDRQKPSSNSSTSTSMSRSSSNTRRRPPPASKVLISSALPPLVEDEMLARIVEKYVERLEGDHEKAQRALLDKIECESLMGSGSRTPWAVGITPTYPRSADLREALARLDVESASYKDKETDCSSGKNGSAASQSPSGARNKLDQDVSVSVTNSTPPLSPTQSSQPQVPDKTPLSVLLAHDPPLCTRQVRQQMTNMFNEGLKAFCELHPDVFGFVDISPDILAPSSPLPTTHQAPPSPVSLPSRRTNPLSVNDSPRSGMAAPTKEADRSLWACPVDPTNIHPLWEPTLPLWLSQLKLQGVPIEHYKITEDAEETFKAYEIDKRRRAAEEGGFLFVEGGAEGEGEGRVKLRDE